MADVPRYTPHDFAINIDTLDENPFMTDVRAEFTHESGRKIRGIPAFYDGNGRYVIRFSPDLLWYWGQSPSLHCEHVEVIPVRAPWRECIGSSAISCRHCPCSCLWIAAPVMLLIRSPPSSSQ